MGLALECILKGEIMQGYLREQPDLLKEDRDPLGRDDIPKSIKQGSSEITAGSHDLLKLAGKAGFKVNDERQRRLLEDIARLVTWKARYPVPKRAKDVDRAGRAFAQDDWCDLEKLREDYRSEFRPSDGPGLE
jgi:hypothetical protein